MLMVRKYHFTVVLFSLMVFTPTFMSLYPTDPHFLLFQETPNSVFLVMEASK